VEITL